MRKEFNDEFLTHSARISILFGLSLVICEFFVDDIKLFGQLFTLTHKFPAALLRSYFNWSRMEYPLDLDKAKVICLSASMAGSSFLPQFHFMVALERLLKMDLPISFRITCRVLRSTEHWDSIGSSHGICREWRTEYAFHQIHSLHEERLSFCLLVDCKDKCTKQDKLSTSDSKQNPFCSSFDYPKWPPNFIWIMKKEIPKICGISFAFVHIPNFKKLSV